MLCAQSSLSQLAAADKSKRKGNDPAEVCMAQGSEAFEQGAFERAIRKWQQATVLYHKAGNAKGEAESLVNAGVALDALGQHQLSIKTLQEAVKVAEKSGERTSLIFAKSNLGMACASTYQTEYAENNLSDSLTMARADKDLKSVASILNNLGLLFANQKKNHEAIEMFQEASSVAQAITNRLLSAKAMCNAAATAARDASVSEADGFNQMAVEEIQALPFTHETALLFNRAGQTYSQLAQRQADTKSQHLGLAKVCHEQASRIAESIGDRRDLTFALGYLGHCYEVDQKYDTALRYTRKAVFAAQQIQLPDALFLWEWQTGRLLRQENDTEGAITAYRHAIQSLQLVRHDLSLGYGVIGSSFRAEVGPVFFESADLLLKQAESVKGQTEREQLLTEARDTVEKLKSVEMEDYFQDACVNLLQAKSRKIEKVDPHTAIIYIIPLADRTELLASFASGLMEFKAPVGAEQLTETVHQFRLHLELRTSREFFDQGQQLYAWLIGPLKETLEKNKIQTLVFVPDGALRTIPMAALHDGEHFLIEQYAVAVTPGLTLTEPKPIERRNIQVLTAGLSESVQNFPALPHVPAELQKLHGIFQGPELLNKDFTIPIIKKDFSEAEYRIVHLATHGQFSKEAGNSFILTYDGKLTLNQLEDLIRPSQFRGNPVELLTLSACQTAAGDDRAALGLAGVAVKAGARSALATLWFINDESTAALIGEFYTALHKDPSLSKAKALQQAQIKILSERRSRHPCYWAPYLIIGNWL
jgi:CHAT domain-containing protein